MNRSLRAGVALAAVLSLCSASLAQAIGLPHLPKLSLGHEAQAAAAFHKLPPGVWPQAQSDVPAAPDIRFGALPNGMRYAIERQAIPAGQAAIRLRFDAGSLMETDAQAGLAHFLEHMAFNGSKEVPEGDMIKILERLGLEDVAPHLASDRIDRFVLHPVLGLPMYAHVVQAVLDAGVARAVVVVGHGRDAVESDVRGRFDERVACALQERQQCEVAHLEAPARIGVSPERSRAGAGHVNQHGVHLPQRGARGVGNHCKHVGDIEPRDVLTNTL